MARGGGDVEAPLVLVDGRALGLVVCPVLSCCEVACF
jgi:hypothetical protein